MTQYVKTEVHTGIAKVTLARPELHNAFNDIMIAELTDVFIQLGQDAGIRVIVLQAEGKSFCAGADLNWMQSMLNYSFEENVADATKLSEMLRTINECPKPVIGRIHGAAFGGGVGLVSVCDLTVALPSVMFCLSEVKLGLLPAVISPFVLQKMPVSQARRYFITAEKFNAEDACQMGFISTVSPSIETMDTQIATWTQMLLQNGPEAVGICKALIRGDTGKSMPELIAERRISAEGQEGMRAFLEKRPANYVS